MPQDIRQLVRQEQQRRAAEKRAAEESRTLVESEYLSPSSSEDDERRKRPRLRESCSPKKLAHKEKRKGILKQPSAKSETSSSSNTSVKKRVNFDDVAKVREIPKDDFNRGAVMLPGDKALLAAFKARSATTWLSRVEGVIINEEVIEEEEENDLDETSGHTDKETQAASPRLSSTKPPDMTQERKRQTNLTNTITNIENAEAAYRDVVTPGGKGSERKDGFFDENEEIRNEGAGSSDYSIVISSNFDKEDQLESQFQLFQSSIRSIEQAQSAATKASETLEMIQTELKEELAQTSVEVGYLESLRERVEAKGRALSEDSPGGKVEKAVAEERAASGEDSLDSEVQVGDEWWRSKKVLNG